MRLSDPQHHSSSNSTHLKADVVDVEMVVEELFLQLGVDVVVWWAQDVVAARCGCSPSCWFASPSKSSPSQKNIRCSLWL